MQHKQTYYSGTKFVVSTPGLLKITAVILFFTSSVLFLVTPICGGWSSWSGMLHPISGLVSGTITIIMYLIFATGFAKRSYGMWYLMDLVVNVVVFTLMLVVSIVTLSHCSGSGSSSLQMVPAPMGIVGAVLLVTSSAVWFAQSRRRNEVSFANEVNDQGPNIYRKSVMLVDNQIN